MPEPPPEALLRLVAGGDAEALGRFYELHARLVNGLALRILGNTADAEDVVQEVFLQVWNQAARFDARRGSVGAWLCAIARSRALDRLRRRPARREEPEGAAPPAWTSPRNDEALAVRRALDRLSRDQRVALELAYYEGLSHSEIAARLDEPLGTVKTRIRTAMMRLREVLAPPSP
jgi:RNA polymerase sigma-70 factor (ECF subfamily)